MTTKLGLAKKSPFGQVRNIKLKIVAGVGEGNVFKLKESQITLGRGKGNAIEIINARVSKQHAQLEVRGERVWITDLGSGNGTFVNGKRLKSVSLSPGDKISIGGASEILISGEFSSGAVQRQDETIADLLSDAKKIATAVDQIGSGQSRQMKVDGGIKASKVPRQKKQQKKSSLKGLIVLVLVGATVYLVYDTIHEEGSTVTTGKMRESIFSKLKEVIPFRSRDIEKKLKFKKPDGGNILMSPSRKQADLLFKNAYHTYLSNRFNDSVRLFREVLLFDRNHVLAKTYLERAKAEKSELIDFHDTRAWNSFENLRYDEAIVHFRALMILLGDKKNDPRYKNAKNYIKISRKRMKRY